MKKALSVILVIALVLSCNTGKKNKIESISLKDTIFVKPEILKLDKLLPGINNLKIRDSFLMINSFDGKGYMLLFNKHNGKYITTKCLDGRGPGEFSSWIDFRVTSDSIYIYDSPRNVLSIYNIDKFLHDSKVLADKQIKTEKDPNYIDLFPIKDYYVARPGTKARFYLFDRNGKYNSNYELFPDYYKDAISFEQKFELRLYYAVEPKPDLSKFVALSNIGGVMEIFNIEKDSINRILEKTFLNPELKVEGEKDLIQENTKRGFFKICTTDNYIYASYSGLASKDLIKLKSFQYITVFDWEGNLKRLYKVEGGLTAVAADEAEGKIYVVTKDSEGVDAVGVIKM